MVQVLFAMEGGNGGRGTRKVEGGQYIGLSSEERIFWISRLLDVGGNCSSKGYQHDGHHSLMIREQGQTTI
jgi:hypothetical protein